MATQPTPARELRPGEVDYVEINEDGDNPRVSVELPARKFTGAEIYDLRMSILGADQSLRFSELVASDGGFVLLFDHPSAQRGGSDAAYLRRQLAKGLKAACTTTAMISGLVDRAPSRKHIGTTVTFTFVGGEQPEVSKEKIERDLDDVFAVTIHPMRNSIAVSMGTPTLEMSDALAFAERVAAYLHVRIDDSTFEFVDPDPATAAYREFDFDPDSRKSQE